MRSNHIRIIGGTHRGRRLAFPDLPGLRPTGDRMRETLFNWLQPVIAGARCLDAFAGSGALGLEAASRGAGRVVLLDRSPQVVRQLRQHLALLRLEGVEVQQADALEWLRRPAMGFDIVFLDPPFGAGLLSAACGLLLGSGWLREGGLVYLEEPLEAHGMPLSGGLVPLKERRMGRVLCRLARRGPGLC
jgi:16S rRNA (guanine966-N2)-methyltransferase